MAEVDVAAAAEGEKGKGKNRAEEKAARAAARAAQAAAKEAKASAPPPQLTTATLSSSLFGEVFVGSQRCNESRTFLSVSELTSEKDQQEVWVRARLSTSRKQGKALAFLTLRQSIYSVQAVVYSKDASLVDFAAGLPKESVLDVCATLTKPADEIASCSQRDVELQVKRIYCVSRALPVLPLQIEDASRSDADLAADPSLIRVNQDVRLNHRVIDLRTPANQAIFRMQSGVCQLFRQFLLGQGFTEIHSPKLIGTASEGGADVFKVDYFGGSAYLAQSPQLYKQMALMADLERVFEVAPVFRAELSLTHRHMTEFTGLDLEMTFHEHYHEVLDVLDQTFNAIFDGLNKNFSDELEAVRVQHPFNDLRYRYPCLRLDYKEAMGLLREKGPAKLQAILDATTEPAAAARLKERLASVTNHGDTEDIGTEDEKLLGEIIADVHGQDFYIIDKFPMALRPFYTMPDPNDADYSNSYDIFIRGEEVTSGAQRIHDPQMLVDNANAKGVDLTPIQTYVDSFKYGAFPHAGGGVGLERVVMLFLGLPNIRKTSMFPRDPKRLTP